MLRRVMTARVLLRTLSFLLLLAVLVWLFLRRPEDLVQLSDRLSDLPGSTWLMVFLLGLLSYVLRLLRWQVLLRVLGHRIPVTQQLPIYMAGFGLAMTPGKVGETIRTAYLAPLGVPYGDSLAAFVAERLVDLLVVGLLACLALPLVASHPIWVLSAWGFVLSAFLVARSRLLPAMAARMGTGKLGQTADEGARALQRLLSGRPLFVGCLLGSLAWSVQASALLVVLSHLEHPVPVLSGLGSYALALLAGAASFIPGGLGVTEAAMLWLLERQGVDLLTAATAALVSRGVPLWTGVFTGLLALAALGVRSAQSDRPTQP